MTPGDDHPIPMRLNKNHCQSDGRMDSSRPLRYIRWGIA
jgi:hypothetical protein